MMGGDVSDDDDDDDDDDEIIRMEDVDMKKKTEEEDEKSDNDYMIGVGELEKHGEKKEFQLNAVNASEDTKSDLSSGDDF